MLSARLARSVVNVAVRKQAFSQVKFQYTNAKHRDMGGGGHFNYDPLREDPVHQDEHDHGHHGHDDHGHHDHHAHPVFDLPFTKWQAFLFSWGILFSGLGAVWISCQFQQHKQGFTTVKDRFSE